MLLNLIRGHRQNVSNDVHLKAPCSTYGGGAQKCRSFGLVYTVTLINLKQFPQGANGIQEMCLSSCFWLLD